MSQSWIHFTRRSLLLALFTFTISSMIGSVSSANDSVNGDNDAVINANDADSCGDAIEKVGNSVMLKKLSEIEIASQEQKQKITDSFAAGKRDADATVRLLEVQGDSKTLSQSPLTQLLRVMRANNNQADDDELNPILESNLLDVAAEENDNIALQLGELSLTLRKLSPNKTVNVISRIVDSLRITAIKSPMTKWLAKRVTSAKDFFKSVKRELRTSILKLEQNTKILEKEILNHLAKIDAAEIELSYYQGLLNGLNAHMKNLDPNSPQYRNLADGVMLHLLKHIEALLGRLTIYGNGALAFNRQIEANIYCMFVGEFQISKLNAIFSTILLEQTTAAQTLLVARQIAAVDDSINRAVVNAGKMSAQSAASVARIIAAPSLSAESLATYAADTAKAEQSLKEASGKARESANASIRLLTKVTDQLRKPLDDLRRQKASEQPLGGTLSDTLELHDLIRSGMTDDSDDTNRIP
jgi:hypothetical protein